MRRADLKPVVRRLRAGMTGAEERLWSDIRAHRFFGIGFRRQVVIGRYVVDFVSHDRKLVIEIDGDQHETDTAKEYDAVRTRFLEDAGYRVIRFSNREVLEEFDGVMHAIGVAVGVMDSEKMDRFTVEPEVEEPKLRPKRTRRKVVE